MSQLPVNSQTLPLIGMSREQLAFALEDFGLVASGNSESRLEQLWHWLYFRGAPSIDQMAGISPDFRSQLSQHFDVNLPSLVEEQVSEDGTRKWLLRFGSEETDSVEVETVFIPENDRGTLCVSSQVGCSLTCTFCHTGTQKMVRNLTVGEIVGQIIFAKSRLGDFENLATGKTGLAETLDHRAVTNIVMMGMGEPLFNFENVKQALLIAMDDAGLCFSRRRVTLSTSGVVPKIYRTGEEIRCSLAISLHATRDELRDVLVPINRKYPLAELLEACREYPQLSNSRRIVFEYVMLKGVNDTLIDAAELAGLLQGIPSKVNLIPFNKWPGSEYECSDWSSIESFARYLKDHGVTAPIRMPRGRDILAACGQLKSESQRVILKS